MQQTHQPLETVSLDDLLAGYEYFEKSVEEYHNPNWLQSRIRLSRPLVWIFIALSGLLVVWAMLGNFASTSWSMYDDTRVDLSECLIPLQTSLDAAGVPEKILYQLEMAAQPNIWGSEALERLTAVDKVLNSMGDDPAIVSARQAVRAIMQSGTFGYNLHCKYNENNVDSIVIPLPIPTSLYNASEK